MIVQMPGKEYIVNSMWMTAQCPHVIMAVCVLTWWEAMSASVQMDGWERGVTRK